MTHRFAASFSEHPLASQAVGETAGHLLDQLDGAPDLLTVFISADHAPMAAEITRALRALLNPRVVVGACSPSVLGGAQEVEDAPALSLFAARLGVEVEPIRLEAFAGTGGDVVVAGGSGLARGEGTLMVLAEPRSFPLADVTAHLAEAVPAVTVVGGTVRTDRGASGSPLLLDDERFRDGAVGVLLPPDVGVAAVVSQGSRPFGAPLVASHAEGTIVAELDGRPALERLMSQLDGLGPVARAVAADGIQLGILLDEDQERYGPGDFVVWPVLGADRTNGALAVGGAVPAGSTVQFHLRDATSADEELRLLLAGRSARAAVIFTTAGRGRALFGTRGHDAACVSDATDGGSVAGIFCEQTVGPLHGQAFVHPSAATVALFR